MVNCHYSKYIKVFYYSVLYSLKQRNIEMFHVFACYLKVHILLQQCFKITTLPIMHLDLSLDPPCLVNDHVFKLHATSLNVWSLRPSTE